MEGFTPNQWLILLLAFVLGLLIGMFMLAGNKWKGRYREEQRLRHDEVKRREEIEADRDRLARERSEWEARNTAPVVRDDRHPIDDGRTIDDRRTIDDTRPIDRDRDPRP